MLAENDVLGAQLTPEQIVWLSALATGGLAIMWGLFWWSVARSKESIHQILLSAAFFRTVAVMGIVAATVVLSLAGRLGGNTTGAILSGIVGYVLGQLSGRERKDPDSHALSARHQAEARSGRLTTLTT